MFLLHMPVEIALMVVVRLRTTAHGAHGRVGLAGVGVNGTLMSRDIARLLEFLATDAASVKPRAMDTSIVPLSGVFGLAYLDLSLLFKALAALDRPRQALLCSL